MTVNDAIDRRLRSHWTLACCICLALPLASGNAQALVTRLTPLKEVLGAEELIFIVRVERLDSDKCTASFQVTEQLKGNSLFRSLVVSLKGDRLAEKEGQAGKLLKRLSVDLPLLVFSSKRGQRQIAFAYANGSWFQIIGMPGGDPAQLKWTFTHFEPYLRRTFKGTTTELEQIVREGLAGKKDPPPADPNAEPGLGPEVKPKAEKSKSPQASSRENDRPPTFAVIPTFVIVGPLAILATLFPALFAGIAVIHRRWAIFFTVASSAGSLYLLDGWFGERLPATFQPRWILWLAITIVGCAGLCWLLRRATAANLAVMHLPPLRSELIVLWSTAGIGLVIISIGAATGSFTRPSWKELLPIWFVPCVGLLYALILRRVDANRWPPLQAVMLGSFTLAAVVSATASLIAYATVGVSVAWTFTPTEPGAFLSSPVIAGDRVYVAALHGTGLSTYGAVYCLDAASGEQRWKFDNDGEMKQVFCTPVVAHDRLFIGEGLHEDGECKFYCLDAVTGQKLWERQTTSHTESNPCIAGDCVVFGAGDDGIYCCDCGSGDVRWHFQDAIHVDAGPVAANGRLYFGSGVSRLFKTSAIYCLDIAQAQVLWRWDTDLPVWSSPAVVESRVIFSLGNGKLDKSALSPAGALLCVDAETGEKLWRYDVGDAVLGRPVVNGSDVFFGSRDRNCYCVNWRDGSPRWKMDLGSPIVTAPACSDGKLFVVPSEGPFFCLDAEQGTIRWSFNLAAHAGATPRLFSSPVMDEANHRVLFGTGLQRSLLTKASLYSLHD
jgi:outer membrane protein assembly factor BamB